jgi:hypothetical protein
MDALKYRSQTTEKGGTGGVGNSWLLRMMISKEGNANRKPTLCWAIGGIALNLGR